VFADPSYTAIAMDTHTPHRLAWLRHIQRTHREDYLAGIGIGAAAGLLIVLFI
jgi:hypothetical protein